MSDAAGPATDTPAGGCGGRGAGGGAARQRAEGREDVLQVRLREVHVEVPDVELAGAVGRGAGEAREARGAGEAGQAREAREAAEGAGEAREAWEGAREAREAGEAREAAEAAGGGGVEASLLGLLLRLPGDVLLRLGRLHHHDLPLEHL